MFRRLGQFAFGIAGILALLAIVQFLPPPDHSYFWDRVFDTGHIVVFGLTTLMILTMADAVFQRDGVRMQYAGAMALSVGIGVALEAWQAKHGRTAEWIDMYSDGVGIVAFAAIYAIFDSRISAPRNGIMRRAWLGSLAAFILLLGVLPLLPVIHVYRVRNQLVPQLVDFEQPWDDRFYYVQSASLVAVPPPVDWPTESSHERFVGRITMKPGRYPGFVMIEPHPDWSAYNYFEMNLLYDDEEPRDFVLRVHDAAHGNNSKDRFRRVVRLEPGFQTIRISLDDIRTGPPLRSLDMKRIAGFALFTSGLEHAVTLYCGDVRLVN